MPNHMSMSGHTTKSCTTSPWKGRIATPAPLSKCWRDPSEEVVHGFGPSTCYTHFSHRGGPNVNEGEGGQQETRLSQQAG